MNSPLSIEIIPTCVPHDVRELAACAERARSFSQKLHIDVDDGIMTSEMTWPYVSPGKFVDVALTSIAGTEVSIHLMVKDPRTIGTAFAFAGAVGIVAHMESFTDSAELSDTFTVWRNSGAIEVGLSILIDTPLADVFPMISLCDVIQVMSVASIGSQGAAFDPRATERVRELHSRFPWLIIAIDGGVSEENIGELVRAGATRFNIGAAIMKDPNPIEAYARIKAVAENALK